MVERERQPASAPLPPISGRFTEVRIVMTAYGPAKVQDDGGGKRDLLISPLRPGVRYVPYIERDLIGGAFCIAPDKAVLLDPKTARYPVLDVRPAFALGEAERQEILLQLNAASVNERFGEVQDLTAAIRNQLAQSQAVGGASYLAPDQIAANLVDVQASQQFGNVFLLETADGARFVLAIGVELPTLRAAHAFFAQVDEAQSIRLRCAARGDVWLAPLR
ncbi:MAG: hypothetical protein JXR83_15100 [Deltaproteobacteria bacterium]|nr:hypothetical protein [Deltaproteobacteria bacterium]